MSGATKWRTGRIGATRFAAVAALALAWGAPTVRAQGAPEPPAPRPTVPTPPPGGAPLADDVTPAVDAAPQTTPSAEASSPAPPDAGEPPEARSAPLDPPAAEQPRPEPTSSPDEAAPSARQEAPKVAVIVVGDPDDRMRALARGVDDALEPALRRPFDPGLRAALRGEPGRADGLGEVRQERRRLGMGEARDAPILATLGRRAGAVAVAVVRAGEDGPELVVVDVRSGQFFEGTLSLSSRETPARLAEFVRRRALVSARIGPATSPAVASAQEAAAGSLPAESPPEEDRDETLEFFEQYWPYMVAAALLGGMIAALAITAATDSPHQPVLRFVPGGR